MMSPFIPSDGHPVLDIGVLNRCCALRQSHPVNNEGVRMPDLVGYSHLDLTVTDGERSARWWQDIMGFELVNRFRGPSFSGWSLMHPTGLVVSVMTHDDGPTEPFSERRVGLDHLSFHVADRAELERWIDHLDASGVEHSVIIEYHFGPTVVLRDPDNIQLELFVHPSEEVAADLLATDPAHR